MTAITFDTHKVIKRLEASGVPPAQAEATVEAFAEIVDTSQGELATKADLKIGFSDLRAEIGTAKVEIGSVKADVLVLKWMMGFLLAGIASLVLKAFFHG